MRHAHSWVGKYIINPPALNPHLTSPPYPRPNPHLSSSSALRSSACSRSMRSLAATADSTAACEGGDVTRGGGRQLLRL